MSLWLYVMAYYAFLHTPHFADEVCTVSSNSGIGAEF